MKFQDALKARLDCMNVSEQDLEAFKKAHPAELSPGELLALTSHTRRSFHHPSGI